MIEMLSRVRTLEYISLNNFSCTAAIATALAKVIAWNKKLKNIELAGCKLDREGCRSILNSINGCKDISLINLSCNVNIGKTSFGILNTFTNIDTLTHVDVAACHFDHWSMVEFCEVLYSCKNLKHINLGHNTVVKNMATEISFLLSSLTSLEYFNVFNCQLDPSGTKTIVAKLKELNTLQCIYINSNTITHDAVEDLADMITNNKSIRTLALPEYDGGFYRIEVILRALKTNSSLQFLKISRAQVFLDAAIELAAVLANNANMEQVVIAHLELDSYAFMKISNKLCKIRELRHLVIILTTIDDKNVDHMAEIITNNPTIEKLNLSGCKISLQGKLHIFYAILSLNKLEYFSINNIDISGQLESDLTRILSKNVKMKRFEMGSSASKLTENGIYKIMISLENYKQLTHFNFNNNIISDSNLSHLLNLIKGNQIVHLELSKCNITSLDVLMEILSIRTLQHLDLSHNPTCKFVTTTRQSNFGKVSVLAYLNLSHCKMPEQGTEQVMKYLRQCRSLTHLDLSSNLLNLNSSVDLVTVISSNKLIETLYLPVCPLPDNSIKEIILSLKNTSTLSLVDLNLNQITDEMADDVAAMLNNNVNLAQLKIFNLVLEGSGFEILKVYLPKFKTLHHLSFSNCEITDKNAEIISTVINNSLLIKNLIIYNCMPTCTKNLQSIFMALKNLKSLQVFRFVYNCLTVPLPSVNDDLLAAIGVNIKLKAIALGGCALAQENIITILRAIKYLYKITHFKLEDSSLSAPLITKLTDLQFGITGLEQLTLSNCKLTGEEVNHWLRIMDMSKLKHLDVSNNPISALGARLIQNVIINTTNLQYLNLSGCMLQPEQLDQLIVQLKVISSLLYLNISGSNLSDEIAVKLKDVIIKNTNIQHLHFSNCSLTHSRVKVLFNAIKHNSHVKYIDISLNETNSNMFNKELIDEVTSNQFLESIMLSTLELGQHELQILSQILPLIGKLEHFTIIGGAFTYSDACKVATLISNNKSLKYLKISDCVISDTEKLTIFTSMKNVTALTHITLHSIVITDKVKDVILTVIANNPRLQHIEMTGCLNIGFVRSMSSRLSSHKHIISKNIS